jgi:ATP-dependent RNA helicase RhlE
VPPLPTPRPRAITPLTPETAAAMAVSPFAALGVDPRIVRALIEEGYTVPTPIQQGVIEHVLQGRDTVACAQTGTGKTAAFVVPTLHRLEAPLAGRIRALILTPTRELAAQIDERISCYGQHMGLRHTVVYGGVSQHRQEIALQRLPDILVATPGRLMDLMQQGFVKLDGVTTLVLDEADRMLDMGFIRDVQRIVRALPQKRQTLFFSATMPPAIENLANSMLVDPVRVAIAPTVTTAERVEQSVMFVDKAEKTNVLQRFLNSAQVMRAIVFTRTKHGANRLAEQLEKAGIESAPFHGNKSQNARERALESFRTGATRVLVATDVAARGIDIEGITHVVNYDLPNVAESYVHRIGRTGRAGAAGAALSFCDREERGLLRDIERFIKKQIPIVGGEAPREHAGPRPTSSNATAAAPLGSNDGRRPSDPRRHRGMRTR